MWKSYSRDPDVEWIRTELNLWSARLYGSQMCSLSTNLIPFESLTPSPAEGALSASVVHAASPMYCLGLRDKHMQSPAMQSSHTLRESGRLVRPPKLKVKQCKMSRLQSLHSYCSLSPCFYFTEPACRVPGDSQLCLRIAQDTFILSSTKRVP